MKLPISKSIFPAKPITRFAPSPTGHLHLGHVISMAFVFGIASLTGAKVLLRMEDHDGERCRKEYEQAILDDMAWLNFIPDNWQDFSLAKTSYRQSDCQEEYHAALESLKKEGKSIFAPAAASSFRKATIMIRWNRHTPAFAAIKTTRQLHRMVFAFSWTIRMSAFTMFYVAR